MEERKLLPPLDLRSTKGSPSIATQKWRSFLVLGRILASASTVKAYRSEIIPIVIVDI
jgi:hypothetical protein